MGPINCNSLFLVMAMLVGVCSQSVANSTQSQWNSHREALSQALDSGKFQAGLTHARHLQKMEAKLEPEDPRLSDAKELRARLALRLGKLPEALALADAALAMRRQYHRESHSGIDRTLLLLGEVQLSLADYTAAQITLTQAMNIATTVHMNTDLKGDICYFLGDLHRTLGNHELAEQSYKSALIHHRQVQDPNHLDIARDMSGLGVLRLDQNRLIDAETELQNALTIFKTVAIDEHPYEVNAMSDLAGVYRASGRYDQAEALYQHVLDIDIKRFGPRHPFVAIDYTNLSVLHQIRGHTRKALDLLELALKIDQDAYGTNHPELAIDLFNLATLHTRLGHYLQAQALLRRALEIEEQAYGPDHPSVAWDLRALAEVLFLQKDYPKATQLMERALSIHEQKLGRDHNQTIEDLFLLAKIRAAGGDSASAEPLFLEALKRSNTSLGSNHPKSAVFKLGLAEMYRHSNRCHQALPLYHQTLERQLEYLEGAHPQLIQTRTGLADCLLVDSKPKLALSQLRAATTASHERAAIPDALDSTMRGDELRAMREHFFLAISVFQRYRESNPTAGRMSAQEAFGLAQLAQNTRTAGALAQMASRFAVEDPNLAHQIRQRQDSLAQWQQLGNRLMTATTLEPENRDLEYEQQLRNRRDQMQHRIRLLNRKIKTSRPNYTALSGREVLTDQQIQTLLAEDEALVSFIFSETETGNGHYPGFAFVFRTHDSAMVPLALDRQQLAKNVAQLRVGLDPTGANYPSQLPTFDLALGYSLYQQLLEPLEHALNGVKHLIVVPDGQLNSLPLSVLPTAPAPGQGMRAYKKTPWLARRFAITVLPSVGTLRALREFARRSPAPEPFIGFGNPILDQLFLSKRGDPRRKERLAALPETARELAAVAQALGVDIYSVKLGKDATESGLKNMPLDRYRILAFSTHALSAGQIQGLDEPALVLTPDSVAGNGNDGLLTAAEITNLRLNADWVILSACNTSAADDVLDREGFSELARAFFYAGSRTVMSSHWPVNSRATVELVSRLFSHVTEIGVGPAEALRRSRIDLIEDVDNPYLAHPALWAAFEITGEGR